MDKFEIKIWKMEDYTLITISLYRSKIDIDRQLEKIDRYIESLSKIIISVAEPFDFGAAPAPAPRSRLLTYRQTFNKEYVDILTGEKFWSIQVANMDLIYW